MPSRYSPEQIRSEIAIIAAMWKKNPNMTLPELDLEGYLRLTEEFFIHDNKVKELDMERDTSRIHREDSMITLTKLHTRIRSVARGYFGPNSAQVSQAGLVRTIERKTPKRTTPAYPPAAA